MISECDGKGVRWALILPACQVIAFWPVWKWYWSYVFCSSEQSAGLLALVTLLIFMLREKRASELSGRALILPAISLIVYLAAYHFVPPLVRAVLAFTSISLTVSAIVFNRPFHPALWGLSMLALPILPSLQFYLGYPLRALMTTVSAAVLQISGYAVTAQGTCLDWSGNLIAIDAPCSGVMMLWAGGYIAFTAAMLYRLSFWECIASALFALLSVAAGNILRILSLFYIGNAHLPAPNLLHDGIGVSAFIIAALLIIVMSSFLERRKRCAPSS